MSDGTRRRFRGRGLLLAAGLTVALATGPSEPGSAGPAVQSGWWMAPVALAPDAPADGMVVQGGAAGELAYGAVSFALTPEEVPTSLLLRVAPDAASTPNTTLRACPLTEPFTPVQGGPMTDAPAYDCEQAVDAEASADGATYTFEVTALSSDDALAVAILPIAPTDRVVLSAPGTGSLTVDGTTAAPPAIDPSSGLGPSTGTLGLPPSPAAVGSSPAFPPTATATPDVAGSPAADLPLPAVPAAQDRGSDERSWLPPLLFLGLAAMAVGLWSAAGARDERARELPVVAA